MVDASEHSERDFIPVDVAVAQVIQLQATASETNVDTRSAVGRRKLGPTIRR